MDVNEFEYESGYFDFIHSCEAISHYKYLSPFLEGAHRILKKGGILSIKDDNNAQNPRTRNTRISKWIERDSGKLTGFGEGLGDLHGNRYKPYVEVREEMIREKYPDLEQEDLQLLAEKTRGYWGQEIYDAVRNYTANHILPEEIAYPSCFCREPLEGQYIERLFYPYELKKDVAKFGFDVRVFAYCATRKPYRYLNPLFRLFSPITFYISKSFRLIGKKTT